MAYDSLVSMLEEAREIDDQDKSTPPKDCPNDGTVLIEDEQGVLTCRWDGWQYRGFKTW